MEDDYVNIIEKYTSLAKRLSDSCIVEELGLDDRTQFIYYDVFTNTGLTQTNPKCSAATDIMTLDCTEEQRRQAMVTCTQILSSYQHTKCLTKYNCDPMDVFVDCLQWTCSNFTDTSACERIGEGIHMCRNFKDLTERVENANCYTQFLPIEV
ncbi:hypothetical protein ACOMHN_017808 [Nucella lapillus]